MPSALGLSLSLISVECLLCPEPRLGYRASRDGVFPEDRAHT